MKKEYTYPSSHTPEEVLAEIIANISKNNSNIGAIQSIYLKSGPQVFRYAVIYQILNAATQEHHHFALNISSYYKYINGWERKDVRNITLDDKEQDEIGLLHELISNFKNKITTDYTKYGVIKEIDYQRFQSVLSQNNDVDAILEDEDNYQELLSKGGSTLLTNLLSFVLDKENPEQIISKLKELEITNLNKINSITGISQLKQFIELWDENQTNDNEEFWQQNFAKFSWSISQAFSHPVVILQNKANLGGKGINNKGGSIIDFLYQNKLTENTVLIEIKTPTTELLGSKYRQTYSISDELSGGINQLLKYKLKIQRNYSGLIDESEARFEVFNPKAMLIIGNYSIEVDHPIKREAFELYRSNCKEIEIITFDELFVKVKILVQLLEGTLE